MLWSELRHPAVREWRGAIAVLNGVSRYRRFSILIVGAKARMETRNCKGVYYVLFECACIECFSRHMHSFEAKRPEAQQHFLRGGEMEKCGVEVSSLRDMMA